MAMQQVGGRIRSKQPGVLQLLGLFGLAGTVQEKSQQRRNTYTHPGAAGCACQPANLSSLKDCEVPV